MNYKEALAALKGANKLDQWLKVKGPKLVRIMRRRKGLSLRKFAALYGVKHAYIWQVESERCGLGEDLAEVLLEEYMGGRK